MLSATQRAISALLQHRQHDYLGYSMRRTEFRLWYEAGVSR